MTVRTYLEYPSASEDASKSYSPITKNIYDYNKYPRLSKPKDEYPPCECKYAPGEDIDKACGTECINRMVLIECDRETCPCGKHCTNQRFQAAEYVSVDIFRTGEKGYGLRAMQGIKKNAFLLEYTGEIIPNTVFEKKQSTYAKEGIPHFYFMNLDSRELIDATKKGSVARFINHSCNPNCFVEKWIVKKRSRIGIFALRDIKIGEELTFNYKTDRQGMSPQKCLCGEENCCGILGGKLPEDSDSDSEPDISPIEDPEDVPAVIRSMLSTLHNRDEVFRILCRLEATDEIEVFKVFKRLHGLLVLKAYLVEYKRDDEIVLKTLEVLPKLPILARTTIEDSHIEEKIEIFKDRSEKMRELVEQLKEKWSTLTRLYRIPKKPKEQIEREAREEEERERREKEEKEEKTQRELAAASFDYHDYYLNNSHASYNSTHFRSSSSFNQHSNRSYYHSASSTHRSDRRDNDKQSSNDHRSSHQGDIKREHSSSNRPYDPNDPDNKYNNYNTASPIISGAERKKGESSQNHRESNRGNTQNEDRKPRYESSRDFYDSYKPSHKPSIDDDDHYHQTQPAQKHHPPSADGNLSKDSTKPEETPTNKHDMKSTTEPGTLTTPNSDTSQQPTPPPLVPTPPPTGSVPTLDALPAIPARIQPGRLHPNWREVVGENGPKYYYNMVTHKTQWERPEVDDSLTIDGFSKAAIDAVCERVMAFQTQRVSNEPSTNVTEPMDTTETPTAKAVPSRSTEAAQTPTHTIPPEFHEKLAKFIVDRLSRSKSNFSKEEFKQHAKTITHLVEEKELRRSNPALGMTDSLKSRVKKLVDERVTKILARRNQSRPEGSSSHSTSHKRSRKDDHSGDRPRKVAKADRASRADKARTNRMESR